MTKKKINTFTMTIENDKGKVVSQQFFHTKIDEEDFVFDSIMGILEMHDMKECESCGEYFDAENIIDTDDEIKCVNCFE